MPKELPPKECSHPCCGVTCRKKKETKRLTPIRWRSKKMDKAMAEYRAKKDAFLKRNPLCGAAVVPDCDFVSQQVHHKAGRIGANLLDESTWLAVCAKCHRYIETHPQESKELGLSQSRLNKRA